MRPHLPMSEEPAPALGTPTSPSTASLPDDHQDQDELVKGMFDFTDSETIKPIPTQSAAKPRPKARPRTTGPISEGDDAFICRSAFTEPRPELTTRIAPNGTNNEDLITTVRR